MKENINNGIENVLAEEGDMYNNSQNGKYNA
jgi:hypothetical protein